MRVLLAFDKFKDCLTAPAACEAAAKALRQSHPDWVITQCPLTDGGEGFAEILTRAGRGEIHRHRVTGPRGRPVEAAIGLVPLENIPAKARAILKLPAGLAPKTLVALIEMATASGLALLDADERDPWHTTTSGTGELIRRAMELGAGAILLGVGGSATNDLGLGVLAALGWTFATAEGRAVRTPTPAEWKSIARITAPVNAKLPPIRIACDVANPLLGPTGAAAVYGPQKGLAAPDLPRLEAESARLAALLCAEHHQPASSMAAPGAGAAGGIAFGLMTAVGAQLLPGADFVAAWLDVESHLARADLVITGEGRFDESSLSGKGPGAIATRALELGKRVHVFAGQVAPLSSPPSGLQLHTITPPGMPLPEALKSASRLLASAIAATL